MTESYLTEDDLTAAVGYSTLEQTSQPVNCTVSLLDLSGTVLDSKQVTLSKGKKSGVNFGKQPQGSYQILFDATAGEYSDMVLLPVQVNPTNRETTLAHSVSLEELTKLEDVYKRQSIISVLGLCKLFGLSDELAASLIPKSVTTPIAMEISQQQGGIVSITVAAVIVTGIFGAIFAPTLLKLFRVKDPVEAGIAIGTCSHALGTSKAVELGEVEGAMSGIAIGAAGIFTVLLSMFL